jgi:hypothetical protein
MENIFDFIEDACEALDLLSRFYRISYDKSKEIYDNEGRMIDDGITEEIGWSEGDIYNTIENDEGITYTFNDACEHLTEKYEENIDAFIDMGEETGAHFISLLESKFLTIDEMQRIALIRKIVRTSFAFFLPSNYVLYESIQEDSTCCLFKHRNFMPDDEAEEYEEKDEKGMYKALSFVTWLINECCIFLSGVGTLCSDYNINLQEITISVFRLTTTDNPLKFDILGDNIGADNIFYNKKKDNIIMNWEGQNNVLTDMFRQAKNRGYLTNSIPEIASFLKDNFSCFEKTKLSTIETQLKNNNSSANAIPKDEKRIKLEE